MYIKGINISFIIKYITFVVFIYVFLNMQSQNNFCQQFFGKIGVKKIFKK